MTETKPIPEKVISPLFSSNKLLLSVGDQCQSCDNFEKWTNIDLRENGKKSKIRYSK